MQCHAIIISPILFSPPAEIVANCPFTQRGKTLCRRHPPCDGGSEALTGGSEVWGEARRWAGRKPDR